MLFGKFVFLFPIRISIIFKNQLNWNTLKIQFFSRTLNPNSKPKKDSPEQWAREKRYEYLKNLAIETRSDWIMTGHHSNDNAETILMNLLNTYS